MLNELICYAENKRDEAAENSPDDVASIRYWAEYIERLRAAKRHAEAEMGKRD